MNFISLEKIIEADEKSIERNTFKTRLENLRIRVSNILSALTKKFYVWTENYDLVSVFPYENWIYDFLSTKYNLPSGIDEHIIHRVFTLSKNKQEQEFLDILYNEIIFLNPSLKNLKTVHNEVTTKRFILGGVSSHFSLQDIQYFLLLNSWIFSESNDEYKIDWSNFQEIDKILSKYKNLEYSKVEFLADEIYFFTNNEDWISETSNENIKKFCENISQTQKKGNFEKLKTNPIKLKYILTKAIYQKFWETHTGIIISPHTLFEKMLPYFSNK